MEPVIPESKVIIRGWSADQYPTHPPTHPHPPHLKPDQIKMITQVTAMTACLRRYVPALVQAASGPQS